MVRIRTRSLGVAMVATLVSFSQIAKAQSTPAPPGPPAAPNAGAPPAAGQTFCAGSPLTRVPVYVALDMQGKDAPPIPASVSNLLQAVADRVDTILGAPPNVLPEGEPKLNWESIAEGLDVTWYRDGRLVRTIDTSYERSEAAAHRPSTRGQYSVGARLLDSAFAAAQAAGDLYMTWPDIVPADSMRFRISFVHPSVDASFKTSPPTAGLAVPAPVFTVGVPVEQVVGIVKRPMVRYPMQNLDNRVSGVLLVQFVVDTTGRADMSTFRDVWPADLPRLTGEKGRYYDTFLDAIRDEVSRSTFSPARIGNCKVRQMVQTPFHFKMR